MSRAQSASGIVSRHIANTFHSATSLPVTCSARGELPKVRMNARRIRSRLASRGASVWPGW